MTFEEANAKGDPSLFRISTSVTDLCSSCARCEVCMARPTSWVQECRYYLEEREGVGE